MKSMPSSFSTLRVFKAYVHCESDTYKEVLFLDITDVVVLGAGAFIPWRFDILF
jgi:hypothetical protein